MARIIVPGEDGAPRAIEVDRELTIGRASDCDVTIADPSVSSHHLSASPAADGVTIRDLGSTNGTYLNGQRVLQPTVAHPGDHLRLGQAILIVEGVEVPAASATVVAPPHGTVVATLPAEGNAPAGTPPPSPPPWRLVVRAGVDAGKEVTLTEGQEIAIGRAADSGLVLTDARVSSSHVQILRRPEGLVVRDLGSANGTLVRGVRIPDSATVQPGDEIQVGETVIVPYVGDAGPDAYAPTPTIIELTPSSGMAAAEVEAIVRKRSQRTMAAVIAVGVVALIGAVATAFLLLRDDDNGDVVPAVVNRNDEATVQIINLGFNGAISSGSGSVIDRDDGLILTNNHVANGGDLLVFSKELEDDVEAELVAAAVCEDLALIRISDEDDRDQFSAVELGQIESVGQGDLVVAMGYPGSAEGAGGNRLDSLNVTSGIISKVDVVYDVPGSGLPTLTSVIQHEAAVNPGNSGGPLFDSDGRQVGVNTAIFFGSSGRVEGANYAVTIGRVHEVIDRMKEGYSPGWFGASFEEGFDRDGESIGLIVHAVMPGSEADQAGFLGAVDTGNGQLTPSELIIAVDGEPITTLAGYCGALPDEPGFVVLTVVDVATEQEVDVEVFIGAR